MGDDKGKSPHAFHTGLQSGYKTIKGKDFEKQVEDMGYIPMSKLNK